MRRCSTHVNPQSLACPTCISSVIGVPCLPAVTGTMRGAPFWSPDWALTSWASSTSWPTFSSTWRREAMTWMLRGRRLPGILKNRLVEKTGKGRLKFWRLPPVYSKHLCLLSKLHKVLRLSCLLNLQTQEHSGSSLKLTWLARWYESWRCLCWTQGFLMC